MKKLIRNIVTKKAAPSKKTAARAVKKTAPIAKSLLSAKSPSTAKPGRPAVKSPARAGAAAPKANTRITASIDVGFGNALYLRGKGCGLSWDKGVRLECVSADSWTITLAESDEPLVCKLLLNDTVWCAGEDFTIPPGSSVVLTPNF